MDNNIFIYIEDYLADLINVVLGGGNNSINEKVFQIKSLLVTSITLYI